MRPSFVEHPATRFHNASSGIGTPKISSSRFASTDVVD